MLIIEISDSLSSVIELRSHVLILLRVENERSDEAEDRYNAVYLDQMINFTVH